MEQIKFKNGLMTGCYCAYIFTMYIVISWVFCIIMTYFFEDARNLNIVFIAGASAVVDIWVIACLAILLQGTVIVTECDIRLCRGKKTKWSINKEDIRECVYNKTHWYVLLVPIYVNNMFILLFKLQLGGFSRKKYCYLSLKQVKIMRDKFHYPITINED